ncbi:Crp/Fnr family transcriptional regulator [Candidatus Saccharibacteria bacterium]|nr:Crp/Fnr family transcriptional regulator [Candidatus Saccharibacteria bacterium]
MVKQTNLKQKNEQFFTGFKKLEYDMGDVIIQSLEPQEYVYYIARGKVVQYDISPSGNELTLNTLAEGAFFSANWLFEKSHTSSFFYKAGSRCTLHRVPNQNVLRYLESNQDVALDLLARIARGSDGILKRLSAQMSNSAQTQLVTELLIELKRFSKESADGSFSVRTSINELTAKSGLARETVSRQLSILIKDGIIRKERGSLVIIDRNRLESLVL